MGPGLRTAHRACCDEAVFTIIGTLMWMDIGQTERLVLRSSRYRMKNVKRCIVVWERLTGKFGRRPGLVFCGLKFWSGKSEAALKRASMGFQKKKKNKARQCSEIEWHLESKHITLDKNWRYPWKRSCLVGWRRPSVPTRRRKQMTKPNGSNKI